MERDEAIKLLKGGEDGVREWNRRREDGEAIPNLDEASLDEANLSGANLREADLLRVNLSGANLFEADLSRANLSEADLSRANLSGANVIRANLRGAELGGANLFEANLALADLSRANLFDANLSGANVIRANLFEASLGLADLTRANLFDANLRGAELGGANLFDANLSGAELSGANCLGTAFINVNLSEVRGLEEVRHEGPSSVDIDTLARSHGKIPESFLRGCGVPDALIEYMPSRIGSMQPIQFYSCFINSSSKNHDFAARLCTALQAKGVRCWYDSEDLKIGDKIRHRITKAIRVHDKLMLVMSEHSIASEWVEGEVEAALERERREKKTVLFPIRLDDAVMQSSIGWASHIRQTRHIGDFRGWKDRDSFETAFARLLKDLKSEESTGAKDD
jgi:hypothetical protein